MNLSIVFLCKYYTKYFKAKGVTNKFTKIRRLDQVAVNDGRLLVSSLVREEQNNLICEFRRM